MKNTDLSVKILLQKCWTEIMDALLLEFKDFSRCSVIFQYFHGRFNFRGLQESPLNSSTFLACANPAIILTVGEVLMQMGIQNLDQK